jgi:hypothetical protein
MLPAYMKGSLCPDMEQYLNDCSTFPVHGRIVCRLCFHGTGNVRLVRNWKIINDPCAAGGHKPEILVLGFSKGATQAGLYKKEVVGNVMFGGKQTRQNLTAILRAVKLLGENERVDDRIRKGETRFAFASLVRCSLSRVDEKATAPRGRKVFKSSGALITKAFSEIPEIIDNCATRFLKNLPSSVKLIIMLGSSDRYIKHCKQLMKKMHPAGFMELNEVAYRNDRHVWVHLTHPSKGNGTLKAWLHGTRDNTSAIKKQKAEEIVKSINW